MADPQRSNRFILIGFIVLAVATIGMTVYATMTEWAMPPAETPATDAAPQALPDETPQTLPAE